MYECRGRPGTRRSTQMIQWVVVEAPAPGAGAQEEAAAAATAHEEETTLGARLRYEFDKSMAAGPIALIGWLAVVSLLIIIVAGAVLALTGIAPEGGAPLSFLEASGHR